VSSDEWRESRDMNRKITILTLCALLLALSVPAAAQQPAKVPRIGFLEMGSASDPRNTLGLDAFRQGLRELGYVEGKDINIDYRYTERKFERLPELAQELVRLRVDILVANNTTAAQVAKKSTTTIPVVFTTSANPVTSGLVASLARPGGNVTGVTTNSPELVGKRLGLLKEAVPKVSRFAFLMPADTSTIRAMFDDAQATAKNLGVKFQAVEVKAESGFRGRIPLHGQGAHWRPGHGRASTHQF
jgi:putative tryptophan/tyrosine transport system substrate-binding protein